MSELLVMLALISAGACLGTLLMWAWYERTLHWWHLAWINAEHHRARLAKVKPRTIAQMDKLRRSRKDAP